MTEQEKKTVSQAVWIIPVSALAIIVVLAIIWRIAASPKEIIPASQTNKPALVTSPPIIQSIQKDQITISDVIKVRKHWNPGFQDWIGKNAPDFEISDLDGRVQKLSSYKGRTVMLVFWATWCPPCKAEIPNLIELRIQNSSDKLAIVGVSFESAENLRNFAQKNRINYTLISAKPSSLSRPYNSINSIPTTFFIDKFGIVRLVAEGLMLPNETNFILKALDL